MKQWNIPHSLNEIKLYLIKLTIIFEIDLWKKDALIIIMNFDLVWG